jgi:hypothetical protein
MLGLICQRTAFSNSGEESLIFRTGQAQNTGEKQIKSQKLEKHFSH